MKLRHKLGAAMALLLLVVPGAHALEPSDIGAAKPIERFSLPRSWRGIRLGMTVSELRKIDSRLAQILSLDRVPDFDPKDFDEEADTMTQCMTVGCPGGVNFTGGLEGGLCLYTFFRNTLAAFACPFPDKRDAEQLDRRWRAKYGKPKSATDWKGLQVSFPPSNPSSVIGGAWQDSRTHATIAEAGITLEDLAANNAMRAEAAKIAAEGPKRLASAEQNGTESAPEREMREEAERQQQQSSPLTLVEETYGFPSYGAYRTAVDKIARLNSGQELTEEQALNLSLQLAVGSVLPAGTRVAQLEEEGSAASNVLHWALKVRVLNGADVGEELWIPAFADLKDCSSPPVNSEWPQFCNGE